MKKITIDPMSSVLSDEEIDNAMEFGFEDFSNAFVSMIVSPALPTPFTIAIHGEWGSGKTSLLKTICKKLDSQPDYRVKTIWFDAWEFGKLTVPLWIVFINRVTSELESLSVNPQTKEKLEKIAKTLLTVTATTIVNKITSLSVDDIKELANDVSNDIPKIESMREELSRQIDSTLEENNGLINRIVVFVDDLDRCLPEQAADVFESIKLFLSCHNCVFVIGIDKDQIRRAFVGQYGERGQPTDSSYVDKFIQLQFELPRKTPDEIKNFLTSRAPTQLANAPTTIELISRFIEPNPRKIKRWINSVIFLEELLRVKEKRMIVEGTYDMSLVSVWLFLKSFFPDFASRIEKEPSLMNLSIKVAKKQGSEEDKKKMGDFTLDKQLSDFLSVLKDDYPEGQLKEVIYLSMLTPTPQNISRLPENALERISNIPPEEFVKQITMLSTETKVSLAERMIEKLLPVENSDEWEQNRKFAELLDTLVINSSSGLERSQLAEKVLFLMARNGFGRWFFDDRLINYVATPEVKEMILQKNYLDLVIGIFEKSGSFQEAKNHSTVIGIFLDQITEDQFRKLVLCCKDNSQIQYSWGAQSNLRPLFEKYKEKLAKEDLEFLSSQGFL